MKIFFTADTHFSHRKIIDHCKRPFANVTEMDETIIRNWNEAVQPEDHVYILGDFAMGNRKVARNYACQLNGHKHLIFGNHDRDDVRQLDVWESASSYDEVTVDMNKICLFHYPCRSWNRAYHGSYALFGHVHGSLPNTNRSADVGVDVWNFRPVTFKQIRDRLKKLNLNKNPKDKDGE